MARFFMLINKFSGVTVIIDDYRRRMSRMRRRVFKWAEVVGRYYPDAVCNMITLTYDIEGVLGHSASPGANDIRDFSLAIRKRLKKSIYAYAWVSELQKRGVLHYHFLAVTSKDAKIGHPDKNGLWSNGMSSVDKCKVGVYYICSYTSKRYQKDFSKYPKGARLFGLWVRGYSKELRLSEETFNQSVMKGEGWESY